MCPVIMLSTYENAPYVKRALADGAAGYLLKDATPEDLSPGDQRRDVGQRQRPQPARDPEPVRGPGVRQRLTNGRRNEYSLTQREHDILALLAEGARTARSRGALYLSEKTVKAHLAAIFRKLGVTNRTQAAMMAVQMGVGPVPGALVIDD